MRWHVTGADSVTGLDTFREIDADTAEQAERVAHDRFGVLVSGVSPVANVANDLEALAAAAGDEDRQQALPYATPANYLPQAAQLGRVPNYEGIVNGARLLKSAANTCSAFGVVCIVLAVLTIIGAFVFAFSQGMPAIAVPGCVAGHAFIAGGMFLFNRATMLRLQAELALATRDIARNSFRR